AAGAEVRISGGTVSVTDGPFSEAKEVIGGFAIYDVASREEAVAWTERFMDLHRKHWPGWEGVSEIRQMYATDCQDANAPFQETPARETA
ncbi:YciI family protein, partial [Bauldia litoralis]